MPLIAPLSADHDAEVAELSKFFNETLGFTPNSVLTMQRRPAIAAAFIQLNKAVMDPSHGVPSTLKRLIGYVASHAAGCRYCQAHTALAASRYGVSDAKLADIWSYGTSDHYSEAERAALDFAVAASAVPNAVTPAVGDRLRAHWSDDQIVEILGVVALFGYLNRWNDSMATSLEPGAEDFAGEHLAPSSWAKEKHV